jgi:hypothetical protein
MTVRSALRKLMDAPEFSLIACTLGQRESLGRFLDSLLAQEMRDFEVIVVDQSPGGHLDRLLDGYKGRLSVRDYLVRAISASGMRAGVFCASRTMTAGIRPIF